MIELNILAWGCVLALVHIFAAGQARTRQYGTKWNAGPRDEDMPPLNPVAARLARAQSNYFETFPIVVAAILLIAVTGAQSRWTAIGAMIWLTARVIYLPLYAAGVPVLRSLVFLVSLAGLVMLLWPSLF